jgi:hypothetical protein
MFSDKELAMLLCMFEDVEYVDIKERANVLGMTKFTIEDFLKFRTKIEKIKEDKEYIRQDRHINTNFEY